MSNFFLYLFLVTKGDWRSDLLTVQDRRAVFCMNFFVFANKAVLSCRRNKKANVENIAAQKEIPPK